MKKPIALLVLVLTLTACSQKTSTPQPSPVVCSEKCVAQTVDKLFALDLELANKLDDSMLIRDILLKQKGIGDQPSRYYAEYIWGFTGDGFSLISIGLVLQKLTSEDCKPLKAIIFDYVGEYKKIKSTHLSESELNDLAVRFYTDRHEQQKKCLK